MRPYRTLAEPSPPLLPFLPLLKRERVVLFGKHIGFIDEDLYQALRRERLWRLRDQALEWVVISLGALVVGIIFAHYF
jgi:hypothetical protein